MQHLHVIQATDPLGGGGMATSVVELNRAMRQAGLSSAVVATSTAAGVSPEEILFARIPPHSAFFSPGMALRAGELVNRETVVHLHGLHSTPHLIFGRQARQRGAVIVIHPHGMLEPWALKQSRLRKAIAKALYGNRNYESAAVWRALTSREAEQIQTLGVGGRIVVIPNGLDVDRWPLRSPTHSGARRRVVSLGRLHPKKNLELLLLGWSMVIPPNENWSLEIFGPDAGGYRAKLEQLTMDLGVSATVNFRGGIDAVQRSAVLAQGDLLALTSRSEGLPMVVIEAMATGLPVLVTEECNLPEVNIARAGIVVDQTAEGVARGLEALMALPDSARAAIGGRGRRLVEDTFTLDRVIRDLGDALSGLV